jgi:hypothetical protein
VYVGRLKRYWILFKYLISGTPGNKRRCDEKRRDVDDFCKENIWPMFHRKYSKCKIHVTQ